MNDAGGLELSLIDMLEMPVSLSVSVSDHWAVTPEMVALNKSLVAGVEDGSPPLLAPKKMMRISSRWQQRAPEDFEPDMVTESGTPYKL